MIIQVLVTIFGLYNIYKSILRLREGDIPPLLLVVWDIVWVALVAVVWIPQSFDVVSNILGLSSRGIDAAAYAVILVLIYAIYRITLKLEHLEYEVTALVRSKVVDEVKQDQIK